MFSLANYKDQSIYVIGGRVQGTGVSESVLVFDLEIHDFKESASLNHARWDSSSTVAGETIYVFGGFNGTYLDTIEALDVSSPSSKWEMIHSMNYTARSSAVVCSLSDDHILICGGFGEKDVLVFDTKTRITRKVTDAPVTFNNHSNNQAYIERDGVVLAHVEIEKKG